MQVQPDQHVSMNMWGLPAAFLDELEKGFPQFLSELKEGDIKSEYLLPKIIEKLVEAQETIADFMENNHDETMEIVANALDLDVAAVEDMYGDYDFSIEVTDKDREGFQKTADFMLEAGMIENEPDVNSLFVTAE